MFRKSLAILLALVMVLSVITVLPFTAAAKETDIVESGTSKTQAEALAWVRAQVGKSIDTDGFPSDQPYQCVDLVRAYYSFLGVDMASGNGGDYTWNALPSGWQRLQGVQPQPGDVLVYTDGGFGHVAIYEADRLTYHQNFAYHPYVETITYAYNGLTVSYWGVIRPNFAGSAPDQNVDLGTNFYSTIENPYTGTVITGVDGNDVKSYALNSSLSQWWKFENCGNNNEYRITNCSYNKCIDVYCADNKNNTNVDLYTSNDTSAQRWYIRSASSGYVLVPKCAGSSCIDIEKVSSEDGANIQIFTCSSNNAQVFKIPYRLQSAPCDMGAQFESTIVNTYSGKAVTNKNGSVQLHPVDGTYSQAWGFYRSANLSYEIFTYRNWGSCLDVANGLPYNNTAVDIYSENNTAAQRWFILNEGEGKLRLVPQISTGRTLDIKDGNTADGNSFQIYDYNKTNAQYFSINPGASFFSPLDFGEHFKAKISNTGAGKAVVGQADDNVVIHSNDSGLNAVWEFSRNTDGSYFIVNCEYNKRLDLYASLPYNHTNIGLYEPTNSYGQRWFIVKSGENVAFVPACVLMRCMDVKEANSNDGTNVELFSYSESSAQKFNIIKIEEPTPTLIIGDTDGDEEVTILDATAIQRHLASIPTATYIEEAADVDSDGEVTAIDVSYIQRYLAQMPAPDGIGKPII